MLAPRGGTSFSFTSHSGGTYLCTFTSVEVTSSGPSLQHLLDEFPSVLNKSKVLPKPTHHMQHLLVTEGHPVTAKYQTLDNDMLEAAQNEFADTA